MQRLAGQVKDTKGNCSGFEVGEGQGPFTSQRCHLQHRESIKYRLVGEINQF